MPATLPSTSDKPEAALLIDERRRFLIGLFRALAQLAAVDLVHGSVGLSSLCWDGITTQLINLEHTVNTGEGSRSSLSRNGGVAHPGDDVRAERLCPKTGIRLADSLLEIQWHTRQMHRIAAGKPVDRRGALPTLVQAGLTDGFNAFRRVRG